MSASTHVRSLSAQVFEGRPGALASLRSVFADRDCSAADRKLIAAVFKDRGEPLSEANASFARRVALGMPADQPASPGTRQMGGGQILTKEQARARLAILDGQ